MNEVKLQVKRRTVGKKAVKAVRNEGSVPGVYYTKGQEPIAISADAKELRPFVFTSDAKVVNLELDGKNVAKRCVIQEVEIHPVTEKILHFDMFGLSEDQKINVQVPIILKGTSIGVREGGVLQHTVRKAKISCLPKDLPSHIELDISGLRIGKSILIRDIPSDKFTFALPGDALVVGVAASRTSAATPGAPAAAPAPAKA
jgi:large subunit ribosomal protein L25